MKRNSNGPLAVNNCRGRSRLSPDLFLVHSLQFITVVHTLFNICNELYSLPILSYIGPVPRCHAERGWATHVEHVLAVR